MSDKVHSIYKQNMLFLGLVPRSASILEMSIMHNFAKLKTFTKHLCLLTDASEIGIRELMLLTRATPWGLAINCQNMFEGAEGTLL
jgi:hypothetical protein